MKNPHDLHLSYLLYTLDILMLGLFYISRSTIFTLFSTHNYHIDIDSMLTKIFSFCWILSCHILNKGSNIPYVLVNLIFILFCLTLTQFIIKFLGICLKFSFCIHSSVPVLLLLHLFHSVPVLSRFICRNPIITGKFSSVVSLDVFSVPFHFFPSQRMLFLSCASPLSSICDMFYMTFKLCSFPFYCLNFLLQANLNFLYIHSNLAWISAIDFSSPFLSQAFPGKSSSSFVLSSAFEFL